MKLISAPCLLAQAALLTSFWLYSICTICLLLSGVVRFRNRLGSVCQYHGVVVFRPKIVIDECFRDKLHRRAARSHVKPMGDSWFFPYTVDQQHAQKPKPPPPPISICVIYIRTQRHQKKNLKLRRTSPAHQLLARTLSAVNKKKGEEKKPGKLE